MDQQMGIVMNRTPRWWKNPHRVVEGFDRYAEAYFGRSYIGRTRYRHQTFFDSERRLSPGDYVEVEIDEVVGYDLMGHAK